jgi:hypothetical protein
MITKQFTAAMALLLSAGCATFERPLPVAGQSTSSDVQKLMGAPTEKLQLANGGSVWFYATAPGGRTTNAVRFGSNGVVQSVEQVLTEKSIRKLVPGVTRISEVKELLGPPGLITRQDRQKRTIWEYKMYNDAEFDFDLYVQMSDDNIVREVLFMKDYHKEPDG